MNYSEIYRKRINCANSEEVFQYLIHTLKDTITKWDYFVNWAKVFDNMRNIEIEFTTKSQIIQNRLGN